ncbi:MAG: peptide chain release factor N(5)-glutamine methyltransferase [Clostridia bacterium]|nr:peptide chain release factor N(5)-glutamine methyltransferase [Clostridia bacterium]
MEEEKLTSVTEEPVSSSDRSDDKSAGEEKEASVKGKKHKKAKSEKKRMTSIGGQALIEGVMMRGRTSMAMAVRDEDGIIRVESKRIKPPEKRNIFLRLPIVRGCVSFIDSMIGGSKCLMRSAEVFGEGEPTKFEKWVSEKLKVNVMSVISVLSLILGLALAVFLFIWAPQFIRELISKAAFGVKNGFSPLAKNFIEGGFKILIFVSYILLTSLMPDVKRTFMYHGAEHKTIACYENGLEMTPQNAKKCSRIHDRCGTTFMVFVMVISILVFALVESILPVKLTGILRILLKIACLPIVAGLSYELLKGLAKTKSKWVLPLKLPGMLLQCVTTREPDEKMLEVAITAFNEVLKMDEDETIEEKKFVTSKKAKEVTEAVIEALKEGGIDETSDAEWIVALSADIKRSEVYSDKYISPKIIDEIGNLVEKRLTGMPLWYCIGNTDFLEFNLKTDERALIPRPETEILAEEAAKLVSKDSKVLDLCTGSGAIAIAIKKRTDANVFASDVSEDALALAKENAEVNGADVTFIKSDMFRSLSESDFDVLVSNPPYIKTEDIETLQKEVKDFEPILALDGGTDGLDFYRQISIYARNFVKPGGYILMECGMGQAEDVIKLFAAYSEKSVIKDLENTDRIVKIKV